MLGVRVPSPAPSLERSIKMRRAKIKLTYTALSNLLSLGLSEASILTVENNPDTQSVSIYIESRFMPDVPEGAVLKELSEGI